eukprot:10048574-Lingulodinium_polyedra.AAC.1
MRGGFLNPPRYQHWRFSIRGWVRICPAVCSSQLCSPFPPSAVGLSPVVAVPVCARTVTTC